MAVCGLWIVCGGALLASAVRSELFIHGCEQDSVDAVEDTDQLFTCGEYLVQGPQWTVYTDEGLELYSGSCTGGSCTPANNQFRLDEVKHEDPNMYTSRLTIENITRDSARKLVCNDSSTVASCDLRIIVPPLYKPNSCSVYISNWMVTGRCTLTMMFSSDNNYTCGWTQNDKEEFGSLQIIPENSTARNSKSYMDGVCLFTKTMPVDDGLYTYSMKVSLSSKPYFKETLYIAKPDPVNVNHTCPNYVYEGSNVSCKCSALTTGSPPAQVEWDGLQNAILLLKSVNSEMNEDRFTCRMTWGPNGFINESTVFSLKVASLYFHNCSSGVRDVTEGTNVSFTCGQYTDQIEWYSFDDDYGPANYIGHCNSDGCKSLNGSKFFLQVKTIPEKRYESTLYIRNLTRHQGFSLRCNEGNIIATCRLRVLAPPILSNCVVSIRDWQVHATCVVENMYASGRRYSCKWRVNNAELPSDFQEPLTEYWLDTRAYLKGVCYASHTLFTGPGNYTYSINIDPQFGNTTVKTLNMVPPGDPKYTCPEVVMEGTSVNCTCISSNPGSPPAQFVWDELNNDILYVPNVQREKSGIQHTCFMTWGSNRHISRQAVLTLKVAVPVSIVPETCRVQLSRWKVQGVCTIQWLATIRDTSACRWQVSYQYYARSKATDLKGVLGSSSFVFVSSVGYNRRVCSFEQEMPVMERDYIYSISVSSHPEDQFSKSLRIVRPGPATHNCSFSVYEGSSMSCKCGSSNEGSPPAEFLWEGVNSDTLHLQNIQRQESGNKYTCRLTWGSVSRETVYILEVKVPVSIVPQTCRVQLLRWKVQGVCTIQWLHTIRNTSACRWQVSYQSHARTTAIDLKGVLGSLSFGFVSSVGYNRRNCSFEQEMPVIESDYSYSISVSSHTDDQFLKSLRIVPPGPATHNCSFSVYEGSSMSCKCSSSNEGSPPAEFLWEGVNSDTLHLQNIQRQDSGNNYTCRETWGLISRENVNILQVIVPGSIVPNSCSVQLTGWTVSGVCTTQWLPTIKTRTCNWSVKNEVQKTTKDFYGVESNVSYKSMDPVDYVNCSFVHQMPVDDGNYTYSISVFSHPADQFSESFYIEKPEGPQQNCSQNVLEGSNITCTCFTLKLGNPPAQIGWTGSNKKHLVIEGVKRERNGLVSTCDLTWGDINYTTPYEIIVAFGPSVTYISSSKETPGDETKTVLVCTAIDVYPSAFFRWNISCEKETHTENTSRCTLSTARVADHMSIQCTASNQVFTEVSSTSIYILKPIHNTFQGGIIAGSVAAVFVLVVIVAVIIVCIKRRKVVNKHKTQTPIVRFAAPSGDIYTIAGTTTVDQRDDEYVTVRDTTYLDNIPKTQTPTVRFAAPSGDLYSIAGPATARQVKQVTIQESIKTRTYATKGITCHQSKNTTDQKNEGMESKKMAIKPKPTRLVDNKLETQRPAVRFAAPSGDLYTIVGPATAGEDTHVTEANKEMESEKMAIKPKPTRFSKHNRQDLTVTGYMNVTEVPTDSGQGVYHVVPWAAMSEAVSSDGSVLDTSKTSEDEYNVLRFQENRTGQEDHAVIYSHLDFK